MPLGIPRSQDKPLPSIQQSSSQFFYFLRLMQLFPDTHPATLHTVLTLCKNDFFCAVDKMLYAKRCKLLCYKKNLIQKNHQSRNCKSFFHSSGVEGMGKGCSKGESQRFSKGPVNGSDKKRDGELRFAHLVALAQKLTNKYVWVTGLTFLCVKQLRTFLLIAFHQEFNLTVWVHCSNINFYGVPAIFSEPLLGLQLQQEVSDSLVINSFAEKAEDLSTIKKCANENSTQVQ